MLLSLPQVHTARQQMADRTYLNLFMEEKKKKNNAKIRIDMSAISA